MNSWDLGSLALDLLGCEGNYNLEAWVRSAARDMLDWSTPSRPLEEMIRETALVGLHRWTACGQCGRKELAKFYLERVVAKSKAQAA